VVFRPPATRSSSSSAASSGATVSVARAKHVAGPRTSLSRSKGSRQSTRVLETRSRRSCFNLATTSSGMHPRLPRRISSAPPARRAAAADDHVEVAVGPPVEDLRRRTAWREQRRDEAILTTTERIGPPCPPHRCVWGTQQAVTISRLPHTPAFGPTNAHRDEATYSPG
jgi:hypothetical protein